jgi:hypothetical protein
MWDQTNLTIGLRDINPIGIAMGETNQEVGKILLIMPMGLIRKKR